MLVLGHKLDYARASKKQGKLNSRSAVFADPECAGTAYLEDHVIAPGWRAAPSVACPNDECDSHDQMILSGWSPPAVTDA